MLVFAQDHLAIDDRSQKARGFLFEPPRARRQIVGQLRHHRPDRFRVEDYDVRGHSLAQQAAPVQAPLGSRHEGELPDRVFQCYGLLLAHPMAQQMGLQGRVHNLRNVGAGVREGDDRTRVAHHLQHMLLVLIGQRLQEELLEVFLQGQINKGLDRVLISLCGDLLNGAVGRVGLVHQEQPFEIRRPSFGTDPPVAVVLLGVGLFNQFAPVVGIPQSRFFLFE